MYIVLGLVSVRAPWAQPVSSEALPHCVPGLSQIPVLDPQTPKVGAGWVPSLSSVLGHSLLWTNMAVLRRRLCVQRRLCARVLLPAAMGHYTPL